MPVSLIPLASAVTGTLPDANAPTGSVIQVVQTTTSTTTSSSSTTPSAVTGMSLSITPSSASNRILVLMSSNEVRAELNTGGNIFLYRNGSSLGKVANEIDFNYTGAASFPLGMAWSYQYLDSPASTSSVTYALFLSRLTGSGSFTFNTNANSIGSALILMEIVA